MEQVVFDKMQKTFKSFLRAKIEPTVKLMPVVNQNEKFSFTPNLIGRKIHNIEVRVKNINEIEQTFGFLNEDARLGNKVILEDAQGTTMMVMDYKEQFKFGKCYRIDATLCSVNPQIRLSEVQIKESF